MVTVLGAIAKTTNDGQVITAVSDGRDAARQCSAAGKFNFLWRFWLAYKVCIGVRFIQRRKQFWRYRFGLHARQAFASGIERPRYVLDESCAGHAERPNG